MYCLLQNPTQYFLFFYFFQLNFFKEHKTDVIEISFLMNHKVTYILCATMFLSYLNFSLPIRKKRGGGGVLYKR